MQNANAGLTKLERSRENVHVAAAAAWKTAQIIDEWKVRSLLRGERYDQGIWKEVAAPPWHTGSRPRKIDVIANQAVESAIRAHRPEAIVTSEEDQGAWDDAPGVEVFLTDPEDGTDNGRALGFADATVVLAMKYGEKGERSFCGGAIATGSILLKYVVFKGMLVEATIQAPHRGVVDEPVSDTELVRSIDDIVPGDPMLIAALGARSKHRVKPPIRALLSGDNPAWVAGVAGTPMAARLVHGPLGSVVSASAQNLRDAAHLPLVAGLRGGLVTDLRGNPLPVFDLFETGDEVPASIAASSKEALDVVLAAMTNSGSTSPAPS